MGLIFSPLILIRFFLLRFRYRLLTLKDRVCDGRDLKIGQKGPLLPSARTDGVDPLTNRIQIKRGDGVDGFRALSAVALLPMINDRLTGDRLDRRPVFCPRTAPKQWPRRRRRGSNTLHNIRFIIRVTVIDA